MTDLSQPDGTLSLATLHYHGLTGEKGTIPLLDLGAYFIDALNAITDELSHDVVSASDEAMRLLNAIHARLRDFTCQCHDSAAAHLEAECDALDAFYGVSTR